jgi:uncharacterized membrane protein (UPF0182 family)
VRAPQDIPQRRPRARRRGRIWLIIGLAVLVVLFLSLRQIATFYTDYLWFGSVHFTSVWRHLLFVKIGLFLAFAAIFFVLLWVNLAIVDRYAARELALGPEDELVRRYQHRIAPHALLVRSIVSVFIALIAASSAVGQWRNYLLFVNGGSFASTDPQFHKNVGFFVFTLPFLSFLVSWSLVALIVVTVVVVVAHYLNGGIRVQQGFPQVSAQVKVHVSVLLAAVALVKAFGYLLARYSLDLSQNGYVQGAGYTDVHARLPALTLLFWISLLAAVILLVNISRRGWALPVLAIGLWAFVAVVVGAIYPALVQALRVNPAQNALERPYIARNISATRAALGLTHITMQPFAADQSLTPSSLLNNSDTLSAVRLWDPELTDPTYEKVQAAGLRSYYQFQSPLAMDRYPVNGAETPTVVGVRQVNDANLPSAGWVNTHLQYTHGYAMVVSPANGAQNQGQPVFAIQDVPPTSNSGLPTIKQPNVYYGLQTPGTTPSYVVGNTGQREIDYSLNSGLNSSSNYAGNGGVQLSSFLRRAAFAVRFSDFNLLISSYIKPQSRLMFMRDIREEATNVAPFLSLDGDPYPALVGGRIVWIQDAYTTTDHYPYSQDANTDSINTGGPLLPNTFNYIRNSVKIVVDAYTGQMKFYAWDQSDPIVQAWSKAFPGLFTPRKDMPADLLTHIRYPEDIFSVQSAAFGRYHILTPSNFYSAGDAWNLSQNPGAGSPSAALQTTFTTNAQGQAVSTGQIQRMAPLYQVLKIPGDAGVSFNLMNAYVPVSQGDQSQTLTAFMIAGCDPSNYGQIKVFVTPRGQPVDGPALIDSRILSNQNVSGKITLLNQGGSSVVLGNELMVPINQSIIYVRPLYVQASRNAFPTLQYVIVVYSGPNGSQVAIDSTLSNALSQVFNAPVPIGNGSGTASGGGGGTTTSPNQQQIAQDIAQANQLYTQIQADLKAGNLGQYQTDVTNLGAIVQQLQQLQSGSSGSGGSAPGSASTTTTTTAKGVALRGRRVP